MKTEKTIKLDWTEAQEIADVILQIENTEEDSDVTEDALAEKWNIDLDTFQEIANSIFQMMDFGLSPLTNTPFVGISKGNMWLAKKEVEQQFIHGMISWATDGKCSIPEGSEGCVKTISSGGKPEFDITISKAEIE
jgi:hypothetical protein